MTKQFIVSTDLKISTDLKNEDLYKDLVKYAKNNDRSISFVVRKAIKEFLNKEKLKK